MNECFWKCLSIHFQTRIGWVVAAAGYPNSPDALPPNNIFLFLLGALEAFPCQKGAVISPFPGSPLRPHSDRLPHGHRWYLERKPATESEALPFGSAASIPRQPNCQSRSTALLFWKGGTYPLPNVCGNLIICKKRPGTCGPCLSLSFLNQEGRNFINLKNW